MKPITLITNTTHEFPEEDQFLAKELSCATQVTITHALDPSFHPNEQSRIIIRNVWPTAGCRTELTQFVSECALVKAKLYNPFDGMGDQQGKEYLAGLFNMTFPVIPTVTSFARCELVLVMPRNHSGTSHPPPSPYSSLNKNVRSSRLSCSENRSSPNTSSTKTFLRRCSSRIFSSMLRLVIMR